MDADHFIIKELLLDDALPGMRLAEAVLDKAGTRLISPGTELTEKSISALRQRGVHRIYVGQPAPDDGQGRAQEQAEERAKRQALALERLEILFQTSLDSVPNQLLLSCLRAYRMGTMP